MVSVLFALEARVSPSGQGEPQVPGTLILQCQGQVEGELWVPIGTSNHPTKNQMPVSLLEGSLGLSVVPEGCPILHSPWLSFFILGALELVLVTS